MLKTFLPCVYFICVSAVQNKLFTDTNKIIRFVSIKDEDDKWMYLPLSEIPLALKRPNHPNNCLTLDFGEYTEVIKERNIKGVSIGLNHIAGFGTEILLEDKLRSTTRTMKYNRLAYTGPTLEIENLDANVMKAFIVEMKQNIFNERDPSKQCQPYPNSMFASYDECDDSYIKKKLATYFPPTFVPVWATDNISLVTTQMHLEKNSINSTATKYWKYYLGNHVS